MIQEHINNVLNESIDIQDYTKDVLKKIEELDKEYNFLSVLTKDLALDSAKELIDRIKKGEKPKLAGVFVTIKDCICIKDVETTSSSKILKGYHPIFDATIVKKLKQEGAIIIGKTLQDEFGFGSFCVNTGIGLDIPKNPFDKKRVAGGSSGGCAVATKLAKINKIPHISIAESTGGSIENPASFCGVIGFCPTYGRVSRNGLLSYSNSLDKIGVMATDFEDISLSLSVISGEDINESTSLENSDFNFEKVKDKKYKIGIIKESYSKELNPQIKDSFDKFIERLKEKGHEIQEVSLPFTFEYGIPAYYIIAMSEASTNLSCLSGLRYGIQDVVKNEHFSEYFKKIRSSNFGSEAKRRIMLGTFTRMAGYRDAFYIRAAQARTKVISEYKEFFKTYDILISPTMPFTAPVLEDIKNLKPIDHYLADIMTVGPNMAGIPHMSIPIGEDEDGLPIGAMIASDHLREDTLISFGFDMEEK